MQLRALHTPETQSLASSQLMALAHGSQSSPPQSVPVSLPFFVRSSTGLPAQIVGLPDRGYVQVGQAADLVVFDYERVQDHATILDPGGRTEGIAYVFVNGVAVVDGGQPTGALPGAPLLRHEVR